MTISKKRLLLIEDDDVDREMVHRLLTGNYEIYDAASGQTALTLLESREVDAALLDFHLPDADGVSLLAPLSERLIPVIVLTAEESPEAIVQVMKNGAQDYLVKRRLSKTALEYAITSAIELVALKHQLDQQQSQLMEQAAVLEQQNQQIRRLAAELSLAEQRERRRIAQVLHDDLQQTIYGIQVRKHLINLNLPEELQDGMTPHIEAMEELIDQAITITRTLAVSLSPPTKKNSNLREMFEWLVVKINDIYDFTVSFRAKDEGRLASQDLLVLIFQLVRELLFNAIKHAEVQEAQLRLWEEQGLIYIEVQDRGVGFSPKDAGSKRRVGFGLANVRERLELLGGHFELESAPHKGTRALIVVSRNL